MDTEYTVVVIVWIEYLIMRGIQHGIFWITVIVCPRF